MDGLIEEHGLRGKLSRVVILYSDRWPDECFAFGTVDGEHWYGISVDAKPGMEFDATDGNDPPLFLPMSVAYDWLEAQGRLEEVSA